MAWNDWTPNLPQNPRRALNIGGAQDRVDEGYDRLQGLVREGAEVANAIRTESRTTGQPPVVEPTEFAINDQTGQIMLPDGSVVKMNAPTIVRLATLETKDGTPLPLLDPSKLQPGFRLVSKAQLAADVDAIDSDSDFWGEFGASLKTGLGLAASALDAQFGNDDPSNAWSRTSRELGESQTIAQFKASEGPWFSGIDEFISGLGQTAGNIGSSVALAAPAMVAGSAAGTAAGPGAGNIGGAIAGLGFAVSGGAQAYGEQATDFYDTALEAMRKMAPEQLADESPLYQRVVAENPGITHEEAMEEVAIQGARAAGAAGALPGALEAMIGGRLGANVLAKLGFRTALAGAARKQVAGEAGRSTARKAGEFSARAVGGGIAAGGSEMLETGLGQAAGARATGVGDTSITGNMDIREGIAASQAGFLLGGLGSRGRSRAAEDLAGALDVAGAQSPNAAYAQPGAVPPAEAAPVATAPDPNQTSLDLAPPAGPPATEQELAQQALFQLTGLSTPEEVEAALPQLLELADEFPGFAQVLQASGLAPIIGEQSPESRAQQAAAAAQQFVTQPATVDGMPAQSAAPVAQQGAPAAQPTNWNARVRGPESAQRAAVSMNVPATAEPIAAPQERTPDGRPVGVAPAPLPNPEPMSAEQAAQGAQTRAQRRRRAGAGPSPVDAQTPATPAQVAAAAQQSEEGVTPSTPEPAGDIAAQLEALADPATARSAVFVAPGNETQIPMDLVPPDAFVVKHRTRGTLITLDEAEANRFRRGRWTDKDNQRVLGYSENKADVMAAGAEPVVVEARTPEGNVAAQQLATATPRNRRAAAAAVSRQSRADANVVETTPQRAQAERTARAAEPVVPPKRARIRAALAEREQERSKKKSAESAAGPVATDRELTPTPREANAPATTVTEREATRARVEGEVRQAPRVDVSARARNTPRDVTSRNRKVPVSDTLIVTHGVPGAVVDLRTQAVDEEQRRRLRGALEGKLSVDDAAYVERVLTHMAQLDTMLDAAVDAAEERLLTMLDATEEGRALLDAATAARLREEIRTRRTERAKAELDPRGRPPGRPRSSPLLFVPLTTQEMLHFGRLVRSQAQAEATTPTQPGESVARQMLAALLPGATDALNDPNQLQDIVRAFGQLTDDQLDAQIRALMPSLQDSPVAKRVMRGPTEVARVTAADHAKIDKKVAEATGNAEAIAETADETPHLDPRTPEDLGLEVVQGKRTASYRGDLPTEAVDTVEGWMEIMERAGTKLTGELRVMSTRVAARLHPDAFPNPDVSGRWATFTENGKTVNVVAVNWDNIAADPYAIEVLAHEFGHYVSMEVYRRSDRATQQAVWDAYSAWLAANGHMQPLEIFRSHAPQLLKTLNTMGEGGNLTHAYASSFEEWSANHVARFLLTRPEPRSVVEKFFARIADILRSVWAGITGSDQPNAAWADALDAWIARGAADNAYPVNPMQGTAHNMEAFGDPEQGQPEPGGRRTAEAVLNRTTAGISKAKAAFGEAVQTVAGVRDAEALDQLGNNVYERMMDSGFGTHLRRAGLSIMSLDQIERRFRSSPIGEALTDWVKLMKRKAQLARIVLHGGEFALPGDQNATAFTGAAGVIERANQLATKTRLALQDVMLYATHYGVHPEVDFGQKATVKRKDGESHVLSNEHLAQGDSNVVASNRRRYEKVQGLWEQLRKMDPQAVEIYTELRDSFGQLHERTLDRLIHNIESATYLTARAKEEGVRKVKESRRTLREGPYFPLMRFGDWVVSVKLPGGTTRHATRAEAEQDRRNQKAMNPGSTVTVSQVDGEWEVSLLRRGVYFFNSVAEAKAARPMIEADLREQYENANVDFDEAMAAIENESLASDEVRVPMIGVPKEKQVHYNEATSNNQFLQELRAEASAHGLRIDPELAQVMENLYVESLPEFSARKAMLPRQNVMGASREMLRSYTLRYQGAAHAFSSISYAQNIDKAWRTMSTAASNWSPGGAVLNNLRASQDALADRMKDSVGNKVSNMVTDASSLFSLAFSPAYILTNAMQPWMVTLPVLAGTTFRTRDGSYRTLGVPAATTYLKDAYDGALKFFSKRGIRDFIDESKRLAGQASNVEGLHNSSDMMITMFGKNDGERAMLRQLLESGRLDFSFLNSIEDAMRGGWAAQKFGIVSRLGMAVPQQVEAMNRVVTALAAYRVARQEMGMPDAEARDHASDIVGDTQLDYSRLNRPLLFNKAGWAIILQFKLYVQGMYALFVRNAYYAMARESNTPREEGETDAQYKARIQSLRKQGWSTLAYMLGTHGAIGGATGLGPIAVAAKAGLVVAAGLGMGDDDDEWKSSEQLLQEKASGVFGEKGGQVATRGLPTLLGLDVADRLGFPNLLDTKYMGITERDDSGSTMDKVTLYLLGAPYANLRRVVKGTGGVATGDTAKDRLDSLIAGLPAGPRGMAKALAAAKDGLVERDGDTFMSPEELSWRDLTLTALGYQSADVARAYRERSEEKGTLARIQADRTSLLKRWRTAAPADRTALRAEIREFNDSAPRPMRITSDALAKSVAAKRERDSGAVDRNTEAVREYLK